MHSLPTPARAVRFALALSLSLAVPLALTGCSGTQTPAPAQQRTARDYFPLHANAAWSFDSVEEGGGGTPGLVTMRVVRDDGSGGFYIATGSGNQSPPAVYEYTRDGVTRNGELILGNPIQAETRWQGQSGDSYSIRQAGLTRTTPAGTFHDVIEVVRFAGNATLPNGTEYRETFYYAPGVGPVEALVPVMLPGGDVKRFHLTLRGYTLTGEL